MRLRLHPHPVPSQREAKILALFAILLPILLGMMGLVVDGGLLMASYRQTQNAADAAALAAAIALQGGQSPSSAVTAYISGNRMNLAQSPTVNNPPSSGAFANPPSPLNKNNYVEVILTNNTNVFFITLIPGIGNVQTVTARAVAGFEVVSAGEGVGVLNPHPQNGQGITVTGTNTVLKVNGKVIVNSEADGYDTNNQPLTVGGFNGPAAKVSNGAQMDSPNIRVVGGVGNGEQTNYYDYNGQNPNTTLHTASLPTQDPLLFLPTPSATEGLGNTPFQGGSPSISNNKANGLVSPNSQNPSTGVVTLNPGIYNAITITGGTVVFQPGIYVLQPPSNGVGQNILQITGGTVTGNGVMFYNTGSDFVPSTGMPDKNDGSASPNPPNSTKFQGISIGPANVTFTPISGGDFDGMLFYQRRWNTSTASIAGASSNISISGTLYAKWAQFQISGQGSYQGQFLVGSMSVSGGATVTITYAGNRIGKAYQIFLVE